jgi:hypothetical protein
MNDMLLQLNEFYWLSADIVDKYLDENTRKTLVRNNERMVLWLFLIEKISLELCGHLYTSNSIRPICKYLLFIG